MLYISFWASCHSDLKYFLNLLHFCGALYFFGLKFLELKYSCFNFHPHPEVHPFAKCYWEDVVSDCSILAMVCFYQEGKCSVWQYPAFKEWIHFLHRTGVCFYWLDVYIFQLIWQFFTIMLLQTFWTSFGVCWNWLSVISVMGQIHWVWIHAAGLEPTCHYLHKNIGKSNSKSR